jgi:hypothetical protein
LQRCQRTVGASTIQDSMKVRIGPMNFPPNRHL